MAVNVLICLLFVTEIFLETIPNSACLQQLFTNLLKALEPLQNSWGKEQRHETNPIPRPHKYQAT